MAVSSRRMRLLALCLTCLAAGVSSKLVWDPIDWANTNLEKHQVLSSTVVTVDGREIKTGFKTLIRSGAEDPAGSGAILGEVLDKYGKPIFEITEDGKKNESAVAISHDPDFSSLLPVGDKLFMVVHFESPTPASTYLLELEQDKKTGELSIKSFERMDWSEYEGLWIPCAGSVSPWITHIGSEEFAPNAKEFEIKDLKEWEVFKNNSADITPRGAEGMFRYFGVYPADITADFVSNTFKPYLYGYPFETTVKEDGTYESVKLMSMGRAGQEMSYIMPDKKTVYIADDGLMRVFTMFVADKEEDLSCGRLYAAKLNQVDGDSGGIFEIEWIDLGKACTEDLVKMARTTKFSDIFEIEEPTKSDNPKKWCPKGFTSVHADVDWECLKLKEGMEVAASRFETRRYAAMKGATSEFNKWEGISYAVRRRKLYTAMSEIRSGMEDNASKGTPNDAFDVGTSNDIRLDYNPCGCVYAFDVDEKFWATRMYELVCGEPDFTEGLPSNQVCDKDNIASPDNVAVIEEHDGLLIGEDTKWHQNDVIWYYDLKTGELSRILSAPYGSETTSPYWYSDINGFSYMTGVVQHPYKESDQDKLADEENTGKEGYIGYVGPLGVVAS